MPVDPSADAGRSPLFRRLPISLLRDRSEGQELHRHMGLGSLILLGVGGTIGSGIFVLTGTAAAEYAGPAIAISFLIAGLGCLCAGLCYAELASTVPVAGSAYTYAYVTLGELIAWLIGWMLVLEYLFATAAVAIGWSSYFGGMIASFGTQLPSQLTQGALRQSAAGWEVTGSLDLPAACITLLVTAILALGIRKSSRVNALVVTLKVAAILLVIAVGLPHVDPANWSPFIPANQGEYGEFGWSGVFRGAGIAFFSYIGFDMVSSSAQECKEPARTVPIGLLATLGIVTLLFVAMSLVLTGLVPYPELDVASPVLLALGRAGPELAWLRPVVALAIIIGLFAAIYLGIYGQSRIFYAMSKDGLMPPFFSQVSRSRRVPVGGTWIIGVSAALLAAIFPIDLLAELVAIGTLLAFATVCVGALVLRRTHPDLPRAFRTPSISLVAPLGTLICLYVMYSLPPATWVRLFCWMVLGMLVYLGYGRRKSLLARRCQAAEQP